MNIHAGGVGAPQRRARPRGAAPARAGARGPASGAGSGEKGRRREAGRAGRRCPERWRLEGRDRPGKTEQPVSKLRGETGGLGKKGKRT